MLFERCSSRPITLKGSSGRSFPKRSPELAVILSLAYLFAINTRIILRFFVTGNLVARIVLVLLFGERPMGVQRTLSIAKPDAVSKNVIGEIYSLSLIHI